MQYEVLRGKVVAYPQGKEKGLIEVALGAYAKEGDTVHASVTQSMTGVYWLPEIGDVVEVAIPPLPGYEARVIHVHRKEGDQQTADCWTEENDLKQIKTRSGHTVTMVDAKDKPGIVIQTAGGLVLDLDDAKKALVVHGEDDEPILLLDIKNNTLQLAAGKKLTITCGGSAIEMDDSGNIAIKAKGKLELGGQDIILNAQSKLTAKGQQSELSGGMSAKVSGQSQLELTASGVVKVSGAMVKLN